MEQEKKGMSTGKKIGIGCFGLFILIVIIGVASSMGNKNSNTDKVSNPASNSDGTSTQPSTSSAKEKITLTNATAKQSYGYWSVVGEAKNNDTIIHSFSLKATFYDTNAKIVGTAVGVINEIEPGDTKTYDLSSTDKFSTYKDLKVQIDTMF